MRELPKTDSGTDYLQFRGSQTSVTNDDTGVRFVIDYSGERPTHVPLPVADPDDDDPPDNAVARPIAEHLVESNPLVCYGVVCEHVDPETGDVCGDTFDTPKARDSHLSVHAEDSTGGTDGGGDA